MRNPAGRQILEYWTNISGDNAAPLRTELDPIALRRFLPHLFIVATSEADWPSFRLAGSAICDLFDREFRGRSFETLWLGEDGLRAGQIVLNVIRYERPALMTVVVAAGGQTIPYEMMVLPLRSPGQESGRVLGALLPQARSVTTSSRPARGLGIDNWTFLDKGGSFPALDIQETVPPHGLAGRLRGLMPSARSSQNRSP